MKNNQEIILDLINEVLDEPTFPDAEILQLADEAVEAIINPKPATDSILHLFVPVYETLAEMQSKLPPQQPTEEFKKVAYEPCDHYQVPQRKLKSAEHIRGRRC